MKSRNPKKENFSLRNKNFKNCFNSLHVKSISVKPYVYESFSHLNILNLINFNLFEV
jgi:hypothetical protein